MFRSLQIIASRPIYNAIAFSILLLIDVLGLHIAGHIDALLSLAFFSSLFVTVAFLYVKKTWCFSECLTLLSFLSVIYWFYLFINSHGSFQFYDNLNNYRTLAWLFENRSLGLALPDGGRLHDFAFYKGINYVYFGPFPAVLWLMLEYAFHIRTTFAELTLLFSVVNLLGFYALVRDVAGYLKYDLKKTMWMRFFFLLLYAIGPLYYLASRYAIYETAVIFGSTFSIVSSILFLRYYNSRSSVCVKSYLLAGSALSLAFSFFSRANTVLIFIPFFLFLLSKDVLRSKLDEIKFYRGWFLLSIFTIPVLCAGLLYAYYNIVRFGSPFEFGVNYCVPALPWEVVRQQAHQLTSVSYFFRHVYHLVFFIPPMGLEHPFVYYFKYPDWLVGQDFPKLSSVEWGASIFFSSPLLLFSFLSIAQLRGRESRANITILIMLTVFSALYGLFWVGYSPRYLQDFYPYLSALSLFGAIWTRHKLRSINKRLCTILAIVLGVGFLWTLLVAVDLSLQIWTRGSP